MGSERQDAPRPRPEGTVDRHEFAHSDYLVGDALLTGNQIIAAAPGVYEKVAELLNGPDPRSGRQRATETC